MTRDGGTELDIVEVTARYEAWLGARIQLLRHDLAMKHQAMALGPFPFLRATYYRWASVWKQVVGDVAIAPPVLAVGDLHVENFGTWRDAEGRLVWGVNDFDEGWRLPYTNDLVRLATSALVAIQYHDLALHPRRAVEAILEGYQRSLEAGGRAFVLAEHHTALREMAVHRLHDPERYWEKLESLPTERRSVPRAVVTALRRALPQRDLELRIVHRVAGLGSLGRQRFVALTTWRGGTVAREAKALAPSACAFAARASMPRALGRRALEPTAAWLSTGGAPRIYYDDLLRRGVRSPDPHVQVDGVWLVRRLAPDCSRIGLHMLPRKRDEVRLLTAMGWETANLHLGTPCGVVRVDLRRRKKDWLYDAASRMADTVEHDWRAWRAHL